MRRDRGREETDSNTPVGFTALRSPKPPSVATGARSVLQNIRDSLNGGTLMMLLA